jgi:hypothetical protein
LNGNAVELKAAEKVALTSPLGGNLIEWKRADSKDAKAGEIAISSPLGGNLIEWKLS